MGEPEATHSEEAMNRAHELLQAASQNRLPELLQQRSIAEFLGHDWVAAHPKVAPAIQTLKQHIEGQHQPFNPSEASERS